MHLHLTGNADTASVADSTTTTTTKNNKEEEDTTIPPRKRKLRPKSDITPTPNSEGLIPLPINTALSERVPNSYELFLSLRKRVSSEITCAKLIKNFICQPF